MSDSTAPDPAIFRVGLLGHGTVGASVDDLVGARGDRIAEITGFKPVISGVLTRSRGDVDEVIAGADLVVEVMGGLEPAYEYVLKAIRAGKHVVTANKQLLGVHGIVNGTTNFILSEMASTGAPYATALAEAQRLGYAEADPSDDVNGKDAAAKMAILARLAFNTPVSLDDVRYEGIEHLTADDMAYAQELGLSLKLIGSAERFPDGLSVRVHPAFLYAGHPLSAIDGPFNAVTIESEAITEITLSGPGAGGPQTASAVLGDIISAMIPPASTPEVTDNLTILDDVESAFYLHLEVADRPGVLAQIAEILGLQGASIKSVVQKGLGDNARLVMVVHPILESRLFAAVDLIGALTFIRSAPRAIRVIEEQY
jgi:homoserine dehydrogenase